MSFARFIVAASLAAFAAAGPGHARTAINDYVRARAAAADGSHDLASAAFSAALDAAPRNPIVASEALGHSVRAGDWPLALRSARILEAEEGLLPDARFLLIAEAFRRGDWRAARREIDRIEAEQAFAFTVPVLRAWLAFGSRRGDPLAFLPARDSGPATAYAAEHRPLLMAAMGKADEIEGLVEAAGVGPREARLRIALAATLAQKGKRPAAIALLAGDEEPVRAARAALEAGDRLPGGVMTPSDGLGELLVRLALDLNGQGLESVSSGFARLATYAAPGNSQTWMLAAELAAMDEQPAEAVALLANVAPGDPWREVASDQKIRLLAAGGQGERALAEASEAASREDADSADHVRLGQALMDQDRPTEAAAAFARAIQLHGESATDVPLWALWLFRGGAHDEAGQWPEARAALERAYSLAPQEPLVLNYLGYAQLERRENLLEAERLVREAHRLAPDNAAITDSLGWALFLKGQLDEAIELLEQAAAGEPADVEINEHLGDAYYTVGRRTEARFAWNAARVYAEGEDAQRIAAKIERGLTPRLAAR